MFYLILFFKQNRTFSYAPYGGSRGTRTCSTRVMIRIGHFKIWLHNNQLVGNKWSSCPSLSQFPLGVKSGSIFPASTAKCVGPTFLPLLKFI